MLVESLVFGSQQSLFHQLRDFMDARKRAPLLAKLTQQLAICRVDAQWNFWTVIRQHIKTWQTRVGYDDRNGCRTGCQNGPTNNQTGQNRKKSFEHNYK